MNSRRAAWAVLEGLGQTPRRLEKLLHQELTRHRNSKPSDRALAVNLVYAVLRHRLYLDYLLQKFLKQPADTLDPGILSVLRLGAADLAILGTPDFAAVHAAVELAKSTPARRAQGLVNGVLRAFARGWGRVSLPSREQDPVEHLAIKHSHPAWIVQELSSRLGPDETEAWLEADQNQPPLSLRVNTLKAGKEQVRALLAPAAVKISDHPLSPETLVLEGVQGPARDLPGFEQGLWQAQDPGASALSRLLGVAEGMRVLDLCAGIGGKTGHLAALMGGQGHLSAVEISPGRVRSLKRNLARLGADKVEVIQADGANLSPDMGLFERVLVDAPCTALGTMGRRPDVRWRRLPQDAQRLAQVQTSLLTRAAKLLAPGGALLYCTCTICEAENEQVVRALLAVTPGLRLEWDQAAAPQAMAAVGEDGFFRTLPHRHHCDAFFAARFVLRPV